MRVLFVVRIPVGFVRVRHGLFLLCESSICRVRQPDSFLSGALIYRELRSVSVRARLGYKSCNRLCVRGDGLCRTDWCFFECFLSSALSSALSTGVFLSLCPLFGCGFGAVVCSRPQRVGGLSIAAMAAYLRSVCRRYLLLFVVLKM